MESIIFINSKGASLEIGDSAPFILYKIDTSRGKADIQMKKSPFQHGQTYIDTLLDYIPIPAEIIILAKDEQEQFQRRKELNSIFNPLLKEGTLIYKYDGGEKEINVVIESAPVFKDDPESSVEQLNCMINFLAPSPFWIDTFEESQEMAAWIGGLSFPLELPMTFEEAGDKITIKNEGNAETPVIIEFNGPATNPRVDNLTTDKFIRVKRELLEGEKLVITTEFGKKSVAKVATDGTESNAFHYIDLNSEFWQLQLGDNQIKYSADAGAEQATVLVRWKNRYVGV